MELPGCLLALLLLIGGSAAYPASHVPDSIQARLLFLLADTDHDGRLTTGELEQVFVNFDLDGDDEVTSQELVTDWGIRELGSAVQATYLFFSLDADKNGLLTRDPDLKMAFSFFDHDDSGWVSEAEFVIQWQKLVPATS